MSICTGRGTHNPVSCDWISGVMIQPRPPAGIWTGRLPHGRLPRSLQVRCPECGLTKTLGWRAQGRLAEAEEALGHEADISLLPF